MATHAGAIGVAVGPAAVELQQLGVVDRGAHHRAEARAFDAEQDGQPIWREVRSAHLTVRNFSDAFLDAYLAREGEDLLWSVGCYKLEGEGVQLFSAIDGDYFTILGLPLLGLLDLLRRHGALDQ